MKYGKTEAETLRLNGWGKGDILLGDEGKGPDQILITHVGEEKFLCRWKHSNEDEFGPEDSNTTLSCRNWKKVAHRDATDEGRDRHHSDIQTLAARLHRLEEAVNRVLTEGYWPGDGECWAPSKEAIAAVNNALSESPNAYINILHASIAEDILLALRQGADRHHLAKAPSAAAAINFLLSLAQQEVGKHAPLKLTASTC